MCCSAPTEDDLGLYGKPMARNVQLWTKRSIICCSMARAPVAKTSCSVKQRVLEGGLFGYRFQFPPMRVGQHELFWHRPLVAYLDHAQNKPAVLDDAPLGYLTAYPVVRPDLARPVELWPRLLHREPYLEALELFQHRHDPHYHRTALNVRLLLDTWHLRGEKSLPRSLAGQLLLPEGDHSLDAWLASLPRSLDGFPARPAFG